MLRFALLICKAYCAQASLSDTALPVQSGQKYVLILPLLLGQKPLQCSRKGCRPLHRKDNVILHRERERENGVLSKLFRMNGCKLVARFNSVLIYQITLNYICAPRCLYNPRIQGG